MTDEVRQVKAWDLLCKLGLYSAHNRQHLVQHHPAHLLLSGKAWAAFSSPVWPPCCLPPNFSQMYTSCIAWNPSCRSGDGEWILQGPRGCFWHKCQIRRVCLKSEEEEGESVQSPGTTQLQSAVWCAAAASSCVDGAIVYQERSPRRQVMA